MIAGQDKFADLSKESLVFQRGIEREALRVDHQGNISQQPHPRALGAALTHSHITTDYSEALLEFITGVHTDTQSLLQELDELHRFSYQQLDNEWLWSASMPARLPAQEQIPIAYYGTSNIGRLKTIYRHGLWHRYGRKMQTIAGLHYNWSLAREFWQQWALINGQSGDLVPFISNQYFALIRNFRRYSWLLLYLFGSSNAFDRSFLDQPAGQLQTLGNSSFFQPWATSLRMSDLGYNNSAQSSLYVCFNSLQSYADTLLKAISEPYPPYEKIGVKTDVGYKQLSTHILQIENEYYADIRPKQTTFSAEKPLHALLTRGVEYIEIRCLDINPFLPLGIDEPQIDFIDLFLLWCLLQPSPAIDDGECRELRDNQNRVALAGRDASTTFFLAGRSVKLCEQAPLLVEQLTAFAERLDDKLQTQRYRRACEKMSAIVAGKETLLSARTAAAVSEKKSFIDFALAQSQKAAIEFAKPLTDKQQNHWSALAAASWRKQQDIEKSDQLPFDCFLENYLQQR